MGELLIAAGVLTPGQLRTALGYQQTHGGKLAEVARVLGMASDQRLMGVLARQLGVPYRDISDLRVPDEVLRLLPRVWMERHGVLPVVVRPASPRPRLLVAMAEPQDLALVDELAFVSGHAVTPMLASTAELERAFRVNGIRGNRELSRELELDEDTGEEFVILRGGSSLQTR